MSAEKRLNFFNISVSVQAIYSANKLQIIKSKKMAKIDINWYIRSQMDRSLNKNYEFFFNFIKLR